ncbi:hypothetical protein BGX28_006483 [Mortierella sp. GBA30]|nr:hypothetical protein BGX28_006483 [Mortierella sp. GBA30]
MVEHDNVLYFLGGTAPISPTYAGFTSLKLPLNSISTANPENFPWLDLPNPPVPLQISNLTMTFSSSAPKATPSWIDCFATDDGRIVVVGGSFQVLVYNIAASSWGDTTMAAGLKYGPSVASGMFLDPVYIQSRILADGFTALVVCTLTWNSQPQPYYLDTNSWTVTLAIGTSETTPVASSASSSGWGVVPGGGPLLPPAGFRHYTIAILGQDKNIPQKHYGNGRAFIAGGYSSLVTGLVQDWDALTSFPVQQAPSNVVVMFGNAGTLSKATRGLTAYPVSASLLDILPGNGGGPTQQQVEVYDANKNSVAMLSGISGGPRNTIFRGATVIGQGQQIFVHGGLTTLEFGDSSPPTNFLDQSVGVWNGDSQQWGDTVNIYTAPAKSKTLMIGLIAGGAALLIIICLGIWHRVRRRKRMRLLEEDERRTKGMVLKNEDRLQKEHKSGLNDSSNGKHSSIPTMAYYNQAGYQSAVHQPLQSPIQVHAEINESGHNASIEGFGQSLYPHAGTELNYDSTGQLSDQRRTVQEYTSTTSINSPQTTNIQSDTLRSPTHQQRAVGPYDHPVFGQPSYGIAKQEYNDTEPACEQMEPSSYVQDEYQGDIAHLQNLRASLDGQSQISQDNAAAPVQKNRALFQKIAARVSLQSEKTSFESPPRPSMQQNELYLGARPYASTSSLSFSPATGSQVHVAQRNPYMSSPTFSAVSSVPDSMYGGDSTQYPLMRYTPSAGDLTEESIEVYHVLTPSLPSAGNNEQDKDQQLQLRSPPAIPLQTRPLQF